MMYKIVLIYNDKEVAWACGNDYEKLKQWGIDCQKETKGLKFEIYDERGTK